MNKSGIEDLNRNKLKKLIKWEGWKKEGFWIVFIFLLLFTVYGYSKDIQVCKEIEKNPCPYCGKWFQDREIYRPISEFLLRNISFDNGLNG